MQIINTYKRVKYLITNNYNTFILINIKNCAFLCCMLGNFFRRLMDHKQCVNKKQNIEINTSVSNGGQGKYTERVRFTLPPRVAALSILKFCLFLKKKTDKELIKTKETDISAESQMSILNRFFRFLQF